MEKVNLKAFAQDLLEIAWEGANADGGTIQELAEKYNLIEATKQEKPCGDNCRCELYDADFPVTCYRKTDWEGRPGDEAD